MDLSFYGRGGFLTQDGDNGALIAATHLNVPGVRDVAAWKVMYRSRAVQGRPVGVSGTILVPREREYESPVVSWCHGTVGMSDACAPSLMVTKGTIVPMRRFLDNGYIVCLTDYEGLGTPNPHPYLVGRAAGANAIDIVRAAHHLIDVGSTDYFVSGHSQGGHAALWAGIMGPEYAPDLNLRGVMPIAGPSNFDLVAAHLRDSPFRYYLTMALTGLASAYDDLDLAQIMSPEGVFCSDITEEGDTMDVIDLFGDFEYEQMFPKDPFVTEPWASRIAEQDPARYDINVPVLLLHGDQDEQIPYACSERLYGQLWDKGTEVDMYRFEESDHCSLLPEARRTAVEWMQALTTDLETVS